MITSAVLAMCLNSAIAHEGFSPKAHKDLHGTTAIGYGYNLSYNVLHLDKKTVSKFKRYGISERRAKQLATQVCSQVKEGLEAKYEWFNGLDNARALVMLDMGYNLGLEGLGEFDRTLRYIKLGKTSMASVEMLRSRWARQVGYRAKELSKIMKVGSV